MSLRRNVDDARPAAAESPRIYLASKSPRRQALLRQLGVEFDELRLREAPGRRVDVREIPRRGEAPEDYVRRVATAKANAGWRRMQQRGLPSRPVLGADTEVVLDGVIFGKPTDRVDAARMLALLSGRSHSVLTAIALRWQRQNIIALSATQVSFRRLAKAEIERYVASGESTDKAGAYAIQGRAAGLIRRIAGSYSGVVGLPLHLTAAALAQLGFPVL
jgi:septum formation protein